MIARVPVPSEPATDAGIGLRLKPRKSAGHVWAVLVFAALMLAKAALVFSVAVPDQLNGDAFDYAEKAQYLVRHGSFPPLRQNTRPSDASGSYSDFRPPGYATVLAALIKVGGDGAQRINRSARALNFAADLATSTILLLFVLQLSTTSRRKVLGAFIIGIQPWTSAFVASTYPDTLVMWLATLGVAAFAVACSAQASRRRCIAILSGSTFLSLGALLRPEFSLVLPLMTVAALALTQSQRRLRTSVWALATWAAVPFVLMLAVNMSYRWSVAKEIAVYGQFQHQTPGLFKWVATWMGSLKTKEDIMWGPFQVHMSDLEQLPLSAYGNEDTKSHLLAIAKNVKARGYLTKEEDDDFARAADQNIQRNPLGYWVVNRVYNAVHLWVNLGSATYLLEHQAALGKTMSRVVSGFSLAAKLALLGLALWGFAAASRALFIGGQQPLQDSWALPFVILSLLMFALRTSFFGLYLDWIEFRYSIVAWPSVLAGALFATAQISLKHSRSATQD